MSHVSLLPRRGLLKSLAALVTFGGGKAIQATETEPPAVEPAVDDTVFAIFDIKAHGHYQVEHGGGKFRVKPVPRWDVPEIAAREQPMPVDTHVSRWKENPALIVRYWRPGDVGACALCRTCSAVPSPEEGREGLSVCARYGPREMADLDAPLFFGGTPI